MMDQNAEITPNDELLTVYLQSIVRPDDILGRDTLSTMRRGHFDAVQGI